MILSYRVRGRAVPPCALRSVVAEDVAGSIGATIAAGSEIITQGRFPSCFPINHNDRGDVITHLSYEILSKLCLIVVVSLITLIAIFDIANVAHLRDQGINCLVTNRLTTAAIFFIICYEIALIVLVDKLQHVIQSIALIEQFFDLANSISSEDFL